MSGLVNKVKDALHSDKSSEQPSGTAGHHNSRLANKADPRDDSDMDHRAAPNNPAGGVGATAGHTNPIGGRQDNYQTSGTGLTGAPGGTSTTEPTRVDPHSSNLANKADPTATSTGRTTGVGSSGVGSGMTSSTGRTGAYGENTGLSGENTFSSSTTGRGENIGSTTGSSGLQGSTGGYGSSTTSRGTENIGTGGLQGSTGGYGSSTTGATDRMTGTSDTRTGGLGSTGAGAGATDRMTGTSDTTRDTRSSGLQGSTGGYGSSTTSGARTGLEGNNLPGPAPNTAGPHKKDILNKGDPRVDADLDGSKTIGQDKTYSAQHGLEQRDPTDAAQVPPSVMAKHIGQPSVEHEDHSHNRLRRNSRATHQEEHRGL